MMKKIIKIFTLFLCCLLICMIPGCRRGTKFYTISNYEEYLNKFYNQINNPKQKYTALDLRSKSSYEDEHIRQFQNYDLSLVEIHDLLEYIMANYSHDYYLYIFTEEELEYQEIMKINREFQEIYILTANYDEISDAASELFILDHGPYDCGC